MKKLYAIFLLVFICGSVIVAQEKDKSVELKTSIGWTFGCYKEMTFANISESLMSPRYQLEAKIKSGNFLHVITADYFFSHPKSAMTTSAVVYKNYDPVTGETYYEASLTGPIAIVIGKGGKGVGRLVKEKCDFVLSIPMYGRINSLNASNAAAVLMYGIRRARG